MRSLRLAPLLVLGLAVSATPAAAWPYIDVTASETLSTEPLRVRTTFDLSFVGYGGAYDWFIISPLDADTHLSGCSAPAGWHCGGFDTPVRYEFAGTMGEALPPVMTFAIESGHVAPCVSIAFLSHLLGRAPAPTIHDGSDYWLEACLVLDAPVPARPASWGALKATYR